MSAARAHSAVVALRLVWRISHSSTVTVSGSMRSRALSLATGSTGRVFGEGLRADVLPRCREEACSRA